MSAPRAPRKLRRNLRISISDVRMGMFIASLDRPWADTAFEVEGFLLTEQAQLQMLRALVNEVTVDLPRSAAHSFDHLPWDALHVPPETPPASPAPPAAPRREALDPTASNELVHIMYAWAPAGTAEQAGQSRWNRLFRAWWRADPAAGAAPAKTRSAGQKASPGAWHPAPYYLRYEGEEEAASNAKTPVERHAEQASRLAPQSSLSFSRFIGTLYPRDVVYAPLNWMEQLQFWWSERASSARRRPASPLRSARPRPRAQASEGERVPTLVIYRDTRPTRQDYAQARQVMARTDQLMAMIVDEIRAERSISLVEVRECVDALVESVVANPTALLWSARMHEHNEESYVRGVKVAIYMMALGRHLGYPRHELAELGTAGLLLDVGLLRLPSQVGQLMHEERDALSAPELQMVANHVRLGLRMLQAETPISPHVADAIAQHHERMDGSGYPYGLSGEAISMHGRIAAVADGFVAMTNPVDDEGALSPFDALKELFRDAGSGLHAPLVEQFVQAVSIFPIGSLIELSSGEVAVVLEHNPIRRLEPKVLVLSTPDKKALEQPFTVDLMRKSARAGLRILRGLPDGAYGIRYRDYYIL